MRRAAIFATIALAACRFDPSALGPGGGSDAGPGGGSDAAHDARAIDARMIDAGPTPLTLVQMGSTVASPWGNSSSQIAVMLAAPTQAGSVIALYATYEHSFTQGGQQVDSVTDDKGNTYAVVDSLHDGGNGQDSATAYAMNVAAGTRTITANLHDSACCRIIIAHEIAGASTTAPLDGHKANQDGNPGTNTGAVKTGSMTTSADGDYIFAATSDASNASGQSIAAAGGATLRVVATGGNPTVSEDQLQTTKGPIESAFTFSHNGAALSMQMAFKR